MEKRVEFRGVDNGLTETMQKFRSRAKEAYTELLQQSVDLSKSGEKQIRFIEQQIAALEKRNKLEVAHSKYAAKRTFDIEYAQAPNISGQQLAKDKYLRTIGDIEQEGRGESIVSSLIKEQIETTKITSKEEIAEDKKNVTTQVQAFQKLDKADKANDLDPELIAKRRLQVEELGLDQDTPKKGFGDRMAGFSGFLGGMMFDKLMSGISSIPNARTELDLMRPAGGAMGAVGGGVLGAGLSAITAGQIEAEVVGARIGQSIGELSAEAYIRHLETSEEMEIVMHRIMARTNNANIRAGDLSVLGVDRIEMANMIEEVLRASSVRGDQAEGVAKDIFASEKAYGIDRNEVMRMLNLGKMIGHEDISIGAFRAREAGIEAGAFDRNDSRFFLRMLSNTNTLVENLAQVSTTVDRNAAMATILNFNQIGGQFRASDPRSMQNILQMNNAIANPQNEFLQAANFAALRQVNPEGGLFDMLRMQEQGLKNPEVLRAIMSQMEMMGGDEDFQKLALQRRFGLNYDATEELYQNRQAIISGEMTGEEVAKITAQAPEEAALIKTAEHFTTGLEKSRAAITNAFISGASDGAFKVSDLFYKRMSEEVDNLATYFYDEFKKKMNPEGEQATKKQVENKVKRSAIPMVGAMHNLYNED